MAEQIIQLAKNVLKRVVCLYRVSTVGQVEKDDIPMQKQFCREFVQRQPGWEIVKEFSEKGVSGFKVSAKKRDAVQEIQRMALQGEFPEVPSDNILLTGAGFGIEASLIAIIGYTLACLTLAFIYRRNHVGILEG